MTIGEKKRQTIFEKFKTNLNLLVDKGLVPHEKDVYVCPICLKSHSSVNEDDPLTLEDAPPKSLGGKANTLTCRSCNSVTGHTIDFHLTERLREIDSAELRPGTEFDVRTEINGERFQGRVTVESDGTMTMFHSNRNNHTDKLGKTMKGLKGGDQAKIDIPQSRVISMRLGHALLKAGYLKAFELMGYSLILDSCFNSVRNQLQHPENQTYPSDFYFSPPYPNEMAGAYFVTDQGLESLVVLFNLKSGRTEKMFGTFLPLPINDIESVIKNIHSRISTKGQLSLNLQPLGGEGINFLSNIEASLNLLRWVEERRVRVPPNLEV